METNSKQCYVYVYISSYHLYMVKSHKRQRKNKTLFALHPSHPQIYDGSDTSADLIGVYCGTEGPGIVTSTGSSLFLRMESDITGTRSGFHAKYISQGETGGQYQWRIQEGP